MSAAGEHRSHCPICFSLDLVGDRWTLLVLRDLIIRRKRYFRELLASDERIASNILTARLKLLETAGIVTRRPDPESARQVIYEPTVKGLDLLPAMLELARWGAKYDPDTAAPPDFTRRMAADRAAVIGAFRAPHEPAAARASRGAARATGAAAAKRRPAEQRSAAAKRSAAPRRSPPSTRRAAAAKRPRRDRPT